MDEEASNQSPAQHLSVILAPEPLQEESDPRQLPVAHPGVLVQSCQQPMRRQGQTRFGPRGARGTR